MKMIRLFFSVLFLAAFVLEGCGQAAWTGKADASWEETAIGAASEEDGGESRNPAQEGSAEKETGGAGREELPEGGEMFPPEGGGQAPAEAARYYVQLCGAVHSPGVYEMKPGSRLYEAVQKAGGFCDDASEEFCNLAQTVQDGCQYYIPTETEAEEFCRLRGIDRLSMAGGAAAGAPLADADAAGKAFGADEGSGGSAYDKEGRLDINLADSRQFQTLSGIGVTRADAIIAYREENGLFQKKEDIMKVPGIKEGTYNQIKELIVVR